MEEEGDLDAAKVHVSKRNRRQKSNVLVFDDADRVEYLSGFKKRKDKRRKTAEQQKQLKDRHKRLRERKERREALKVARGNPEDGDEGANPPDGAEDEDDQSARSRGPVSGTSVYEDTEITTVVKVTNILDGEDAEEKNASKNVVSVGKSNLDTKSSKLKPGKFKFKKQKKPSLDKRTAKRKMSKTDKARGKKNTRRK